MAARYVPPPEIVAARARLRALTSAEDARVVAAVSCPLCRSKKGEPCARGSCSSKPGVPHRERRVLYQSTARPSSSSILRKG